MSNSQNDVPFFGEEPSESPAPTTGSITERALAASSQSKGMADYLEGLNPEQKGYYYPAPQTFELYVSPLPVLRDVTKLSRVGLLVGLNERQYKRAFAPGYHMFGKGEYSEKLIIVAVESARYQTLYQLRALLASMSSMARTSPLFSQTGSAENLNFLDLLKIAGFSQLTLTNGVDVSHRISIK